MYVTDLESSIQIDAKICASVERRRIAYSIMDFHTLFTQTRRILFWHKSLLVNYFTNILLIVLIRTYLKKKYLI